MDEAWIVLVEDKAKSASVSKPLYFITPRASIKDKFL